VQARVGSLQVSPRQDQVAWAGLTDHTTVQPASAIRSHPNNISSHLIRSQQHAISTNHDTNTQPQKTHHTTRGF